MLGKVLEGTKLHIISYFKGSKGSASPPPPHPPTSQQGSLVSDLPINDVQGVQIAQGTCYFRSIEASPWFEEAAFPLEMVEQLQETKYSKAECMGSFHQA